MLQALRAPRLHKDGVWHIVAASGIPLGAVSNRTAVEVNDYLCARVLTRQLQCCGIDQVDVVLIDQPLFHGVASRLGAETVIYRPTDAHPHGPLARAERRVLEQAHGVVATSTEVLASLEMEIDSRPTLVLENGVDFDHFGITPSAVANGAVYVGALDHRFDWNAVIHMAEACENEIIRLAGPVRGTPPPIPPNIRLDGPTPYRQVPRLLGTAAVGLIPFNAHPGNVGRSPMKFYEYLAAGLWIVAGHTRTIAGRDAPGVAVYHSTAEASEQLAAAFARSFRNDAGIAYSRWYNWASRAATLDAFIRQLH